MPERKQGSTLDILRAVGVLWTLRSGLADGAERWPGNTYILAKNSHCFMHNTHRPRVGVGVGVGIVKSMATVRPLHDDISRSAVQSKWSGEVVPGIVLTWAPLLHREYLGIAAMCFRPNRARCV